MILRSRYFASSCCVFPFFISAHPSPDLSETPALIDKVWLRRSSYSLSLSLYYAGRVGFSFIKWSMRVKSLSNHLDTRVPPLEIDETKLTALEVQESSRLVFSLSWLALSELLAGAEPDKCHHVALSNRLISDTNYLSYHYLHLARPYR